MSDERYAPPTSPVVDERAELPGTGRFDVGVTFNEAWALTWPNFGLMLGVGIVGFLVSLASALTVVGLFLLVPIFAWGGVRFLLNVYDERAAFGDLFSGFQDYGRVLFTMLPLFVLMTLVNGLGQSVSLIGSLAGLPVLEFLGSLVNLAWTFLVMARLNFSPYFAVDQGLGPVASMQAAWDATALVKGNAAVLVLCTGLVLIIGVLCLLVGVIPASMVASLMAVSAYRQLVGRRSAAA